MNEEPALALSFFIKAAGIARLLFACSH